MFLRSIKATNRPVRPPTRPSAPVTPFAALVIAGPAADVTRERPCDALAVYSDAVDEALLAACLAVSVAFVVVEVDSKRTMRRPSERPDRLDTRANDILIEYWRLTGRARRSSQFRMQPGSRTAVRSAGRPRTQIAWSEGEWSGKGYRSAGSR